MDPNSCLITLCMTDRSGMRMQLWEYKLLIDYARAYETFKECEYQSRKKK